jgi:hypothetical protein
MGRVDGVQVAGEATHRAEPEVDGDRLDPLREARPRDSQLDGHRRRSAGLEIGDEARQHHPVLAELEAQTSTQPQVVMEMLSESGHDPTPVGQGLAIVRSRSTSTLA